jgi:hypothetical protein
MEPKLRACRNCEIKFAIVPEDFDFYEKMGVPAPGLCPDCRFKRRSVFRNESTLYKRVCALCGASVITMYHPNSSYVVYCNDCWMSDKWDANSYAQDYDTSRPFIEQLGELLKRVPKAATYSNADQGPNVNSEYTNFSGSNKDCYLIFNSSPRNENCAYSRGLSNNHDVFDTYYADGSERLYENINAQKSSGVAWGQNITDCLGSWFLLNCAGCQNCFGCVNLRHKSYCFFNEQLTKEEWERKVAEIAGSYRALEDAKKKFETFALTFPRRENNNLKSVRCTGDYIFESKDCEACFEVSFSENLKYSFSIKYAKDCYDLLGHGRRSELLLEGVGTGVSSRAIACWWAETSHDVEYCFGTRASEYCFGCDGLRNGKYMILNKKYDEAEYEKLRARIVEELKGLGEYGLFAPPSIAFFAYNEGVGQDNLPMAKEQALREGFRWQDEIQTTKGKGTLAAAAIPDHIKDVPDNIVDAVLTCATCERNYKIIKPELTLYKKMELPIPRQCFNCRFLERITKRGSFALHERQCAKCRRSITTNYALDRPEIVYCEQCYQAEVA